MSPACITIKDNNMHTQLINDNDNYIDLYGIQLFRLCFNLKG